MSRFGRFGVFMTNRNAHGQGEERGSELDVFDAVNSWWFGVLQQLLYYPFGNLSLADEKPRGCR